METVTLVTYVPPVVQPRNPDPDCVAAGAVTDENGNCVCPDPDLTEYVEAIQVV